jgi:molybdopterin converting factor small subunit
MKVRLKSSGYLRDFFGKEPEEVELPENSTVQDLLHWIEEHHASEFPPRIWDFGQHRFCAPVVLMVDGRAAPGNTTPLRESEEVLVLYPVAGG